MLSKREKEIIRNIYMAISKQVYTSSGPSFLSSEDYEEISSFLNTLKRKNHSTCIYGNAKIDPSLHRLPYKCNLLPGKPINCEECKYYDTKKDCSNCASGFFDEFTDKIICSLTKDCKLYSLWTCKPISTEQKQNCSTCRYGCYNDTFHQYFCHNNSIKCENWNKWEARI
jgi:hypothetical protein